MAEQLCGKEASSERLSRKGGGRPHKYAEPSRPVTVTLPESTLLGLQQIDPDRGKAIVKLTSAALRNRSGAKPCVEIVEMATGTGLVIVGPCQSLRQISFLHLVEVAPARYLLAMNSGHDFKNLEIELSDILEDLPADEDTERQTLTELLRHIRDIRKSGRVRMAEILFVNLAAR